MNPANPGLKLTYDDFLLFPDDGQRHELIDGEHYVTPSPNTRHQRVSGNIYFLAEAGVFGRVVELSREAGDVLTTPLLSGLDLPLTRIFEQ